ncbi:hypothetical protein [Hydrogenophaga sp. 2FB]|uniref:hypothetical protein n=1 Tax=Hydrogenophaga sp. 2FB TaxID=2502187 RepID=UPI0010F7D417|nr:hypothetical protein [Hydrogenophaga sp. 2FB]
MSKTAYEQSVDDRRAAARAQRAEGGSLADYGLREQLEWLGGQPASADGMLTVYRAMTERGEVLPGDYVTNSKDYAQAHIENNMGCVGVIVELPAHLDELFPADGPKEFWYLPRSLDASQDAKDSAEVGAAPAKRPLRPR